MTVKAEDHTATMSSHVHEFVHVGTAPPNPKVDNGPRRFRPDNPAVREPLDREPHCVSNNVPLAYLDDGRLMVPVGVAGTGLFACACGARETRELFEYQELRSAYAWSLGGRAEEDATFEAGHEPAPTTEG